MTTPPHSPRPSEGDRGITIRRLGEADAVAVRELAGRDSVSLPDGELLGLEVEGRLLAIQPLADGGTMIADPFARTAELRALLELRAEQLRARAQRRASVARFERAPEHRLDPVAPFARAS
jgi:hypothetical protein